MSVLGKHTREESNTNTNQPDYKRSKYLSSTLLVDKIPNNQSTPIDHPDRIKAYQQLERAWEIVKEHGKLWSDSKFDCCARLRINDADCKMLWLYGTKNMISWPWACNIIHGLQSYTWCVNPSDEILDSQMMNMYENLLLCRKNKITTQKAKDDQKELTRCFTEFMKWVYLELKRMYPFLL